MIFERYSGSDRTGDIPKRYARFRHELESLGREERVSFYDEILKQERDPNWRGCWRYQRAVQYLGPDEKAELVEGLERALQEFEPLAANFRDVESEYARTLYLLIREHCSHRDDTETLFEYALRLVPHLRAMEADSDDTHDVYSLVGTAMLLMARKLDSDVLFRASVNSKAAAHHVAPEAPAALESLVYAFYEARDGERARRACRMFNELGVPYDNADVLHAFCRGAFKGADT